MDKCQRLPLRLVTKDCNLELLPRAAAVAVAVTQICSDMHRHRSDNGSAPKGQINTGMRFAAHMWPARHTWPNMYRYGYMYLYT